jgi:hypothetical protein
MFNQKFISGIFVGVRFEAREKQVDLVLFGICG